MKGLDQRVKLLTGSSPTTSASRLRAVRQWHGSGRRPRYLFDDWPRVARRLRAAQQLVLFLDFDGTLAPLQTDPERVWLDEAARGLLRRLARSIRVIVISGRRRADVSRRVNVTGVECLGLYGREDETNGWKGSQSWRLVDSVRRLIEARLRHLPGILVENKGPVFAVDFLGATPDAVRRGKAVIREVLKAREPDLRLIKGKSAWDVLPGDFKDKGAAVERLARRFPAGTLMMYLGDDVSDEAAFQVLRDSLTVVVGWRRSRTGARFYVRDSAEVKRFLTKLEATIA